VAPATSPASAPAAEAPVPAVPEAAPPSPALPAGRLDALTRAAPLIPVSARVVVTFPAASPIALLQSLPAYWPRTIRVEDWSGFAKRIQQLWGVEVSSAAGECILVVVREAGIFVTCDSARTTPVAGSHLWKEGEAQGWLLRRNERELRVGMLGGRLLIGEPDAVRAALETVRRSQPSLADAMSRFEPALKELAAAAWCGDGCKRTAVFWNDEGYTGVVVAEAGRAEPARKALDAWWTVLRRDWDAASPSARDVGPGGEDDGRGTEAEALKRAAMVLESGQVAARGDRVTIAGQGNPAWLGLAMRMDLVKAFFGEEKRPAP
jgi:hypothetical protein